MKKLIVPALLAITVQSAFAAPMSPMQGYEYDNIPARTADRIWDTMKTDVKGEDCFKRANIWTNDIKNDFGYKTRKIFIHYTNKWKENLDFPTKLRWYESAPDGITRGEKSMAKNNKAWGYHVAPLLQVDGKDMVFDGTLEIAYDHGTAYSRSNPRPAWDLTVRPSTPEEWVEGLTVRGELLWQVRKAQLKEEYAEARKKYRKHDKSKYLEEMRNIEAKMNELKMDQEEIQISCERADTMAEIDLNVKDAWCYVSEAPMYYYSELSLRYLSFGNIRGYNYMYPMPNDAQTEQNYNNGREHVQTEFSEYNLKDSKKEFKSECTRFQNKKECRSKERNRY
jgi:hypothetical protein